MIQFQKLAEKRRSIYTLGTTTQITEPELNELFKSCLYNAPSAFNSQSSRLIVLYGEAYQSFWQMVLSTLQKIVPPEKFPATQERIISFTTGIGTILFFEDADIIQGLQQKMPTYADNFPIWAEHANAMLQYMIWTALAEQNIGASLQHYNPLIDEKTHLLFDIPASWKLIAQMPFGSIRQAPESKSHEPLDKRIKIFR